MARARDGEVPVRLDHAALEPSHLVEAWIWLLDVHLGPVERIAEAARPDIRRWLEGCVLDLRHGRRPERIPVGRFGSSSAEYTTVTIAAAWAAGLDGRSLPERIAVAAAELGYRDPRAFADVLAKCDDALRLIQTHFPQLYPPVNRQAVTAIDSQVATLRTEVLAQRRRAHAILRDAARSAEHGAALTSIRDGWRRLRARPVDHLLRGRYQLFDPPVGMGSMAAVWRAYDLDADVEVAIRQVIATSRGCSAAMA